MTSKSEADAKAKIASGIRTSIGEHSPDLLMDVFEHCSLAEYNPDTGRIRIVADVDGQWFVNVVGVRQSMESLKGMN